MSEDRSVEMYEQQEMMLHYIDTIDQLREALEQIESLTKNSGNGEIFRIHEIAKNALK